MLNKLFSPEYFRERRLMLLTALALLTTSVVAFRVITTVRQVDRKVVSSYTQYGATDFDFGSWYETYEFAAFAVVSTFAAILISARLFKIDRALAYAVIALQHVILIFLFIVTNAILNLVRIAA